MSFSGYDKIASECPFISLWEEQVLMDKLQIFPWPGKYAKSTNAAISMLSLTEIIVMQSLKDHT